MKTIRTIVTILVVALFFIIYWPIMNKCKKLTVKGDPESIAQRDKIAPKYIKKMIHNVIVCTGARVTVEGSENIPDTPCVLAGNHQSYFDIVSILATCDEDKMYGYLSKTEIGKVPFLKTWMETIDCVFIDRSGPRQGIEAVRKSINMIKGGRSLYIFPEGTRSKGDAIGEFNSGALMMATKCKVPVVPFLVNGSYKLYEGNGNKVAPADVTITYFPPIETDGLTRDEVNSLTDKIRDFLVEEQAKILAKAE